MMNHYEPNTSLNLSLSPMKRNLGLGLEAPANSPPSSPLRVFSCNYCRRKFYSSQALGGHQNAHKLERTLAKKSREFSSLLKQHSGPDPARVSDPVFVMDHQGHVGRFDRREVIGYGYREHLGAGTRDQDELDLSLRL